MGGAELQSSESPTPLSVFQMWASLSGASRQECFGGCAEFSAFTHKESWDDKCMNRASMSPSIFGRWVPNVCILKRSPSMGSQSLAGGDERALEQGDAGLADVSLAQGKALFSGE